MELLVGQCAVVVTSVSQAMTAASFARDPDETYPAVLATPFMLGEMERAASALLRPMLRHGEVSVGAAVQISHDKPTPVGATLTSRARFLEKQQSLFWFEVWSEDDGGVVGRGRHARAIVAEARIVEQAGRRFSRLAGGR